MLNTFKKGNQEWWIGLDDAGVRVNEKYTHIKEPILRVGYKIKEDELVDKKDLIGAMQFRHNIKFFDQEKIPSKETIKEIIKESHLYVPHKNNLIAINIKVWGPEFDKEKETLVLSTACGPARDHYLRGGGKFYGDIKILKDRYNEWRDLTIKGNNEEIQKWRNEYGLNFNEQVRAPYLLAFTQKYREPTSTQAERGYMPWVWQENEGENDGSKWFLPTGIHSYAITLLSAYRGLYASYCRCFVNKPFLYTKIFEDVVHHQRVAGSIIFLGIGFKDYRVAYYADKNKASVDEYVKWQTK
jgi:hypothetical protein